MSSQRTENKDSSKDKLKEEIKFIIKNIRTILHQKEYYYDDLEEYELDILEKTNKGLAYGCTGKPVQPTIVYERFGNFYHIIFKFPKDHGEWKFAWKRSNQIKYKELIKSFIIENFSDIDQVQLGFYMRPHAQVTDDRYPSLHFHLILLRFAFNLVDEVALKRFKELPEHVRPVYSLYFLTNPILDDVNNLMQSLEAKWRNAINLSTRKKVDPNHATLIKVTNKPEQDDDDRWKVAKYIANPALHTFRKMKHVGLSRNKGYIKIYYRNVFDCLNKPPKEIPILDFVRRYLIIPNNNFGLAWRPMGCLCTGRFTAVTDAATRLTFVDDAGEERKVIDLEIADIHRRALEFREALLSGEKDRVCKIIRKYKGYDDQYYPL